MALPRFCRAAAFALLSRGRRDRPRPAAGQPVHRRSRLRERKRRHGHRLHHRPGPVRRSYRAAGLRPEGQFRRCDRAARPGAHPPANTVLATNSACDADHDSARALPVSPPVARTPMNYTRKPGLYTARCWGPPPTADRAPASCYQGRGPPPPPRISASARLRGAAAAKRHRAGDPDGLRGTCTLLIRVRPGPLAALGVSGAWLAPR